MRISKGLTNALRWFDALTVAIYFWPGVLFIAVGTVVAFADGPNQAAARTYMAIWLVYAVTTLAGVYKVDDWRERFLRIAKLTTVGAVVALFSLDMFMPNLFDNLPALGYVNAYFAMMVILAIFPAALVAALTTVSKLLVLTVPLLVFYYGALFFMVVQVTLSQTMVSLQQIGGIISVVIGLAVILLEYATQKTKILFTWGSTLRIILVSLFLLCFSSTFFFLSFGSLLNEVSVKKLAEDPSIIHICTLTSPTKNDELYQTLTTQNLKLQVELADFKKAAEKLFEFTDNCKALGEIKRIEMISFDDNEGTASLTYVKGEDKVQVDFLKQNEVYFIDYIKFTDRD